jgi:hypothetical protein
VYSSGVDPVLMQFQPVLKSSSDQRRKWVKSIHRTANTHDVRAIACVGKTKVLGGGHNGPKNVRYVLLKKINE